MPTLVITRNYHDGQVYTQSEVDTPYDDIETFLNITKLNDDNLQNNGITGSSKILTGSIVAGNLGSSSVTTIKIADLNVTTAKIANAAITTTQVSATAGILGSQLSASAAIVGTQLDASANILGSQLAAAAGITGAQISSSAGITPAQIASSGYFTVGSAGASSTSSGSYVTMTSLVSFARTSTRPCLVFVTGEIDMTSGPSNATCDFRISSGGTPIAEFTQAAVTYANGGSDQIRVCAGALNCVDLTFTSGAATYLLETRLGGSTGTVAWSNLKLTVVQV